MEKSKNALVILWQLREAIFDFLKAEYDEVELTGSQSVVIHIIRRDGKQKISNLAKKMGLSNSTISGIIDRLEKRDIVKRSRSKDDKRVVYVEFTSQYKKKIGKHLIEADSAFEMILADASDGDKQKILDGFTVLSKLLEKRKQKDK